MPVVWFLLVQVIACSREPALKTQNIKATPFLFFLISKIQFKNNKFFFSRWD
jgi:hypothetical protein